VSAALISRRPTTFEPGRSYAWLGSQQSWGEAAAVPVTFVAYDPCPAFVIVRTEAGEKRRCLREQVYSLSAIIEAKW
jgi:hypothetical protein